MSVLRHCLDHQIGSSITGNTRLLRLGRCMHLELFGDNREDLLTPAELEARAVAIRLREIATRLQLIELEPGAADPVTPAELETLAESLERLL